jgi:hypothetical protein
MTLIIEIPDKWGDGIAADGAMPGGGVSLAVLGINRGAMKSYKVEKRYDTDEFHGIDAEGRAELLVYEASRLTASVVNQALRDRLGVRP